MTGRQLGPSVPAADAGLAAPPATAEQLFGSRLAVARRYAELLATKGVQRGLIGPREVPRLWDRHLLNCAVVQELIPPGVRVLDVGSGAGLPGVPLALARPDLQVVLVESLERRARFLSEVVAELGLDVDVRHARAEDLAGAVMAPVVTARAVAPLHRLVGWCLPLTESNGRLLAIKGRSVYQEIARDSPAVSRAGGQVRAVVRCGAGIGDQTATVVVIRHRDGGARQKRATRTEAADEQG